MLNGIPKGTKQDLSLSSSYIKLREAQNSMYWSYVNLMICKVQNYHQKIDLTMAAGRSCSLEDWITRGAKIAITANGRNHWATISFKSFVTYFQVWWLAHWLLMFSRILVWALEFLMSKIVICLPQASQTQIFTLFYISYLLFLSSVVKVDCVHFNASFWNQFFSRLSIGSFSADSLLLRAGATKFKLFSSKPVRQNSNK